MCKCVNVWPCRSDWYRTNDNQIRGFSAFNELLEHCFSLCIWFCESFFVGCVKFIEYFGGNLQLGIEKETKKKNKTSLPSFSLPNRDEDTAKYIGTINGWFVVWMFQFHIDIIIWMNWARLYYYWAFFPCFFHTHTRD